MRWRTSVDEASVKGDKSFLTAKGEKDQRAITTLFSIYLLKARWRPISRTTCSALQDIKPDINSRPILKIETTSIKRPLTNVALSDSEPKVAKKRRTLRPGRCANCGCSERAEHGFPRPRRCFNRSPTTLNTKTSAQSPTRASPQLSPRSPMQSTDSLSADETDVDDVLNAAAILMGIVHQVGFQVIGSNLRVLIRDSKWRTLEKQ
nr:hypothetical protein L204_00792 [Cryptococcus depauperatus CBS 7855]